MRLNAPAPLDGTRLAAEIEAATGVAVTVVQSGEFIDVYNGDGLDEEAVRAVVDAHDGTPEPVADPDADLRTAIEGAATLTELKAALLGSSPSARASVAARPRD